MNGLSERLLVSHYENNYGGATAAERHSRASCEELIAAGSVVLHEIYFESLGGHGDNPPTRRTEPPAALAHAHALERDFSGVKTWHAEFTTIAKALAGGP